MTESGYIVRFELFQTKAWRHDWVGGFEHVDEARASADRLREFHGDRIRNVQIFRQEIVVTETEVPDPSITELIEKAKARWELARLAGSHVDPNEGGHEIDRATFSAVLNCALIVPLLIKALEGKIS